MPALADLDVLIVDCQTTGASPAFGCVLELGWGVARASRNRLQAAEAHWIALPEGQRVPRQVRKIHDCDVVYREPDSAHARRLVIRNGALAEASEITLDWVPGERVRRDGQQRALPVFDRAKYDRLRVLTSELKRIARDGGHVAVHFGPRSAVPQRWLLAVLRLV